MRRPLEGLGDPLPPQESSHQVLTIGALGRDSRGERSPWLPLETRPDSPGEPGMQPRDPGLPWRGKLGPGHTPRYDGELREPLVWRQGS